MMAERTRSGADSRGGAARERDERILDAARESVIRSGVRGTTAQEIARGAGLSRMTLYRAMGTVENAILLALTREFRREVAGILDALPAGPAGERLAGFAREAVLAFCRSELVAAVRRTEPELFTPYISERLGRSQEEVLRAIEGLLAEAGLGAEPALGILFAIQGVALGARTLEDGPARERLAEELAEMVRARARSGAAPRTA